MKFSALNVDYDCPSPDFLGSRKSTNEGIKERCPRKSRYFTVVGQSFVKTVADRHGHAAYYVSNSTTRTDAHNITHGRTDEHTQRVVQQFATNILTCRCQNVGKWQHVVCVRPYTCTLWAPSNILFFALQHSQRVRGYYI